MFYVFWRLEGVYRVYPLKNSIFKRIFWRRYFVGFVQLGAIVAIIFMLSPTETPRFEIGYSDSDVEEYQVPDYGGRDSWRNENKETGTCFSDPSYCQPSKTEAPRLPEIPDQPVSPNRIVEWPSERSKDDRPRQDVGELAARLKKSDDTKDQRGDLSLRKEGNGNISDYPETRTQTDTDYRLDPVEGTDDVNRIQEWPPTEQAQRQSRGVGTRSDTGDHDDALNLPSETSRHSEPFSDKTDKYYGDTDKADPRDRRGRAQGRHQDSGRTNRAASIDQSEIQPSGDLDPISEPDAESPSIWLWLGLASLILGLVLFLILRSRLSSREVEDDSPQNVSPEKIERFRRKLGQRIEQLLSQSETNDRQRQAQVVELYHLFLTYMDQCQVPRPPYMTPNEFARLIIRQLAYPSQQANIIANTFSLAFYGKVVPNEHQFAQYISALQVRPNEAVQSEEEY